MSTSITASMPVDRVPVAPCVGLRDRNKARRRRAILDAMCALLREAPGTEPTKEQIAARAEVAPATVYNLIGDRSRLWQALADDFIGELERRIGAVQARDVVARVRQIVEITVAMFVQDRAVGTGVLRGWERSDLVIRRGPVVSMREAIGAAQAAGRLRSEVSPGVLAWSIGTACVGALHQWAAGHFDDDGLQARVLLAAQLALTAVAVDVDRDRSLRALRRRGKAARV